MEGGEFTVICVDTSFDCPNSIFQFYDQIRSVEFYCQRKLSAHAENLVGIATSSRLDFGFHLAPTHDMATVTCFLNSLGAGEQAYECIDVGLLRGFGLLNLSHPQREFKKKDCSVFRFRRGCVVLDVIDFGTRVKDKEHFKAKYLKELVNAMNDNNENEDSCYFLIEDNGLSLSPATYQALQSSLLVSSEVTTICVDTSITSLCCFHDQIRAVKIYCERKLKAHHENLVSIARFGERDLGFLLDPTNCLEKVTYRLRALQPRKQEYIDLLEGFKLPRLGWLGLESMKERIVVFCGSPLLSITGHSPEAVASSLIKRRVSLDVIDFGTWVNGKEDCNAKYPKALVAAMNDNNENEDNHYFLMDNNGFSLSHQISSILPPYSCSEEDIYSVALLLFINFLYYNRRCSRSG